MLNTAVLHRSYSVLELWDTGTLASPTRHYVKVVILALYLHEIRVNILEMMHTCGNAELIN